MQARTAGGTLISNHEGSSRDQALRAYSKSRLPRSQKRIEVTLPLQVPMQIWGDDEWPFTKPAP